jgi:hypothetical protein
MKLVELFKQNFRNHPDWWPEMFALIFAGRSFEAVREFNRRARKLSDNFGKDGHMSIDVYKGNAFEFPSGILGEHSASAIYRWNARGGDYVLCKKYPNHGRSPSEQGMSFSCYFYDGVVVPSCPTDEQVNCSTPYGFGTDDTSIADGHLCNDDTMVQIFYVKHGYAAVLNDGCCKTVFQTGLVPPALAVISHF